jgi:hypothetical protein
VLRLAKQDPTTSRTFFEQIEDFLNFDGVQRDISAEREVKDSSVGEAANSLLEELKHLFCQRFKNDNSHELLAVG